MFWNPVKFVQGVDNLLSCHFLLIIFRLRKISKILTKLLTRQKSFPTIHQVMRRGHETSGASFIPRHQSLYLSLDFYLCLDMMLKYECHIMLIPRLMVCWAISSYCFSFHENFNFPWWSEFKYLNCWESYVGNSEHFLHQVVSW